jgi:hypothetical protein
MHFMAVEASEDLIGAYGVADTSGYVVDSAACNRADVPGLVLVKGNAARDRQRGSHVLKPNGCDNNMSLFLLHGIKSYGGGIGFALLGGLRWRASRARIRAGGRCTVRLTGR